MDAVRGGCIKIAVVVLEFDAHGFKNLQVHIDFASTDLAAARHGNTCTAETSHQGAQHRNAGAHLRHQFIRRIMTLCMLGIDGEGMALPFNGCSEATQNIVHNLDIGNVRDVVQRALALPQHGCGNELQRRVLCAADLNSARNVLGFTRDNYFF